MKHYMQKLISITGILVFLGSGFYIASNSETKDSLSRSETITYYTSNYKELSTALAEAGENDNVNIILEADIDCKDNTLNVVGQSIVINLNGYTIYTSGEDTSLFYVGQVPAFSSKLTEDLSVDALEFPESFMVYIDNTAGLNVGDEIYISDEKSGEFNYIKSIMDEKSILLSERPNTTYCKETGKIELLPQKNQSIIIENGIIVNDNTQKEIVPGTEEYIIVSSKASNSVVYVEYCSGFELTNISIENKLEKF